MADIVRRPRAKKNLHESFPQEPVTDAMLRIIAHQAKQVAKMVPGTNLDDFASGVDIAFSLLKRRIGLTGWICEDQLPHGYDYDAGYFHSRVVDGVRMFPV